ncbi:MAG: hypothetical protein LBD93_03160 [Treponema sp.]|nr:hypothetical protein [Treponema sp.]
MAYCQVSVGEDGIRENKRTAHVLVQHCTVRDGHGSIVIGSETAIPLPAPVCPLQVC